MFLLFHWWTRNFRICVQVGLRPLDLLDSRSRAGLLFLGSNLRLEIDLRMRLGHVLLQANQVEELFVIAVLTFKMFPGSL